jgi:hypothetical protein
MCLIQINVSQFSDLDQHRRGKGRSDKLSVAYRFHERFPCLYLERYP